MLKFDFYESGIGETCIITFPDKGIGIIDAHPSPTDSRPDIINLIQGKNIHFVCLTHPHNDHSSDLVKLTDSTTTIPIFWHTIPDITKFAYYTTQFTKFPSGSIDKTIEAIRKKEAMSMLKLFYNLAKNNISTHQLRNDLEKKTFAGVNIYCISPTEKVLQQFFQSYVNYSEGKTDKESSFPDKNLLSAVLVFQYGKTVAILGGDALAKNWFDAIKKFYEICIPRARIIKIPHHGAANSYSNKKNYLDLLEDNKENYSIICSGSSKHPETKTFTNIYAKTKTFCTANGLRLNNDDPLRISRISTIKYVGEPKVCNPHISLSCDDSGNISIITGDNCTKCWQSTS